ncbi:MAG: MBL fold metallo-hydrolase [Candidatus Odinarchaeia archaeon]
MFEGIYFVEGVFYDSNIYVIEENNGIALVDTGTGKYIDKLVEILKTLNLTLNDVRKIILTHSHYDHTGGAHLIAGTHVEVYASAIEKPFLESGDTMITLARFFGEKFTPIKVTCPVNDGETISIGDFNFKVLNTPGHTMGSICLYEEDKSILISGDTVFADGNFGRVDFPTSDSLSMKNSLKRLAELNVKLLLPGHGGVSFNGHESIRRALEVANLYL